MSIAVPEIESLLSSVLDSNGYLVSAHKSVILTVLICWSCHNQRQTGWLKQQKMIFSDFWGLEVQDQGAGRVGFL